ncbi:hypothetical protein CHS0354_002773 [Potamilus streckersoni]|uniref:TM2 domain-containing protein n=1 Tax=Potamilus streckersoni TaxID=2493646 RepID=A0AAE0SNU2_9BIVA|nr:hypothetical protein CHS0354_002773 [Potamilus streckersoni]
MVAKRNILVSSLKCFVLLSAVQRPSEAEYTSGSASNDVNSAITSSPLPTSAEISSNSVMGNTTEGPVSTSLKPTQITVTPDDSYRAQCPDNASCSNLGGQCLSCDFSYNCTYGTYQTTNCTVKPNITCIGDRMFIRHYECRYCYQLNPKFHNCQPSTNCIAKTAPRQRYQSKCTTKEEILCLGSRVFYKNLLCNWTSGYKWSTALILSITLGGFGVDRFYLGLWKEGIGKLFSFGGLGVWTLVDVILIATGYVGPYDSSLYIYPW